MNRFCPDNPISDLDMKPIAYKAPEYCVYQTVKAMFKDIESRNGFLKDILITYFALSFFCGMRREEILRLSEKDVHLHGGTVCVRMPKGWTKGMAPRPFNLTDNAKKWLASCDYKSVLTVHTNEDGTQSNKIQTSHIESFITHMRKLGHIVPKNDKGYDYQWLYLGGRFDGVDER